MKLTNRERAEMKDGKYNEAVYMPKLDIKNVDVQLRYSPHSLEKAQVKGIEDLPDFINLRQVDIVEMEVANGKPFKVLARQPYDGRYDLVHVILLSGMIVKTVWLNDRTDNHKTLRNKRDFVQKES
jgi:hypothetical protein